jgi:hypothetical protein
VFDTGLGKSIFLYYVLLCRLSSKRLTALQVSNRFILFQEGGPLESSNDVAQCLDIPKGTLALANSTPEHPLPCQAFMYAAKSKEACILQTTSPAPGKWMKKTVPATVYVMDYFLEEEINALGFVWFL